ncbi:MAG TPA: tagaturonate epimerase family protein [Bacteroidales bacterium]|nr:tagaturonate epimerase family protein [Bacteroidales bacterium]
MNPGIYSLGIGDRFGYEGEAQMRAILDASRMGVDITPVWNKSNREHLITGTKPEDVRYEADNAVLASRFSRPYFVDADHIGSATVGNYLTSCDWFTIDVADSIGKHCDRLLREKFIGMSAPFTGELKIEGLPGPLRIDSAYLGKVADLYLPAIKKAAEIYGKIESVKGRNNFITEVSMDEVAQPQGPVDLFFILFMLSAEGVPVQAIAPKFHGSFHKGVDYIGDCSKFAEEFEADMLVIERAVKEFDLPGGLKISVHSGSDKFSIYPVIGDITRRHGKGIHIKTAGTTWLEEVTGLALAGGRSSAFVKELCISALDRREELCKPYTGVIGIDVSMLPGRRTIEGWTGEELASAIRHVPGKAEFNPAFRQLIHLAYKIAAEKKDEFGQLILQNKPLVSECVYENLYHRHIRRIFNI